MKNSDPAFDAALDRFLKAINEATEANAIQNFKNLGYSPDPADAEAYFKPVTVMKGRKYLRIVSNNGQKSVYCFVDATNGDILKAATWAAPAKGARSSIFRPDEWENRGTVLAYGGWLYK